MIKLPFTVSARTARLIGRENVAHAEGAIIELVKNCYDADADFGIVVVNPDQNHIIIFDNGSGMSEKDIKEKWMTIGTNNKEKDFKSSKGRIKAGAKGIGRFALDRLGQKCTMYTLQEGKKDGCKWEADWNEFEKDGAVIGNVYASLDKVNGLNLLDVLKKETSNAKVIDAISKYSLKHGTLIKIETARDDWNEDISQKIYRSLEILTPPDGQNKFDIFFFNDRYRSSFGKIENESFNDYDYKIVATYKKNRDKELEISFHRNEFDNNLIDADFFNRDNMTVYPYDKRTFKKEKFTISTTFYDLMPGYREKEKNHLTDTIGDFTFTLYYFKLQATSANAEVFKYKAFNSAIRKNWASKFGGIKLFRDNFRVRPYGEIDTASYDWLMLGERQGQNPAGVSRAGDFKIRPNQVAGTINFSRLSKLFLDDKSGREGLIENDTFNLFKNIVIGIIAELEEDRSTIAYNLSEYYKEINEDEQAEDEANDIAEQEDEPTGQQATEQNKKLKKGIRSQRRKIELQDEELVMSRAMASAGILIASFSHEFNHIKNKLNNRATSLKNTLLPLLPEDKVKNIANNKNPYYLIQQLKDLDDKIKQWIEFSISLTRKDRRRSKKISLVDYFSEFKRTWKRKLDDRGATLNVTLLDKEDSYSVKMIELDIDTIFDNLIANSIDAFQRDGFRGNRIIDVTLKRDGNEIEIEYKDSGPGISKDIKKYDEIFKAFVTTKRDKLGNEIGTGLGMWLLKSAIDYNKGSVKLFNPDKGFQIKVRLKSFN